MTGEIETLVETLREQPSECEEALRALLKLDLGAFRNAALAVARQNAGSPKYAPLIQFLSRVHLLAPAAADPAECTVESGAALAKAAAAAGAPIDQELATILQGQLQGGPANTRSSARVLQVLEILYALDRGNLVLSCQSELATHPDPRVRSRAALLIVRATRNAAWVASRLLKDEPGVQADAVEALWGIEDDDCRGVLKLAAGSLHARVSAAALVGMHLIGEAQSAAAMLKMAQHASADTRATAVWAMGQTEDARFLPYLTTCFANADSKLRPAVLRALTRIRRRQRAWSDVGELAIAIGPASVENGRRKVEVGLWSPISEDASSLTPTHFALWEGDRLVLDYTVVAQPNSPLLAVGFALPRVLSPADPYACLETGLAACLRMKRKTDLWGVDRYSLDSKDHAPSEQASVCMPVPADPALTLHFKKHHGFAADTDALRKVLTGSVQRDRAARDAMACIRRLFESVARLAGSRHVFLLIDPASAAAATRLRFTELTERAEGYTIAVHGVVPALDYEPNSLEKFCLTTPGGSVDAAPIERVPELIAALYQRLLNRYEIAWSPEEEGAAETALKVASPIGCGSATIGWNAPAGSAVPEGSAA